MVGFIRRRGDAWELRVYLGRTPSPPSAYHAMGHAWEMENRDLSAPTK